MKSPEQPVSDTKNPTPAASNGAWPPNLLRLLIAALIATGLGFVAMQKLFPIFVVPVEIATFPEQSPVWMYERLDNAKYEVDGKNFAVVFGVVGAVLGASCVLLAFGFRSILAILIAVIGSAALGAVGANLSNWMFNNLKLNNGKAISLIGIKLDSMGQSILAYSLLWGLIGLGVGLGIGAFRGFGKSMVAGISGFLGGVLGAMVYVIGMAQFSIGTALNRVMPYNGSSQAVYLVLFTLMIALCIALGCGEKQRKEVV